MHTTICKIFVIFALNFLDTSGARDPEIVVIGSSRELTLTCETSNSNNGRWKWYLNKNLASAPIFVCQFTQAFCDDAKDGYFFYANRSHTRLHVPSVNSTQAGEYTCIDDDVTVQDVYDIVVIDNISMSYEGTVDIVRGESLNVTCRVAYSGSISKVNVGIDRDNCDQGHASETNNVLEREIFCSNITDSFQLICFVEDSLGHSIKTETKVQVHYCPKEIEIIGHDEQVVSLGSPLKCRVDAYPSVEVIWNHLESTVSRGLNEASITVRKGGNYECLVRPLESEKLGKCPEMKKIFQVIVVKSGSPETMPSSCSLIIGCFFLFQVIYWQK